MDPDSTTTIGDGESVATDMPFQSMKAVLRTRAKLRSCEATCRGEAPREDSILAVDGRGTLEEGCGDDNGSGSGREMEGSSTAIEVALRALEVLQERDSGRVYRCRGKGVVVGMLVSVPRARCSPGSMAGLGEAAPTFTRFVSLVEKNSATGSTN
jgi:hypothetical protein